MANGRLRKHLFAVQKAAALFIWLTETVFSPSHIRHSSEFRRWFRKPS